MPFLTILDASTPCQPLQSITPSSLIIPRKEQAIKCAASHEDFFFELFIVLSQYKLILRISIRYFLSIIKKLAYIEFKEIKPQEVLGVRVPFYYCCLFNIWNIRIYILINPYYILWCGFDKNCRFPWYFKKLDYLM